MQFTNFELSLLLILVTEKLMQLKMELLNLSVNKQFIHPTEYEKLENELEMARISTEELKNKIEKILGE